MKNTARYDLYEITDIAENSSCFENVRFAKKIRVPLLLVGTNGIFVFIEKESKYNRNIMKIREILNYYGKGIFFFLVEESYKECQFVDVDDVELHDLKYLIDDFTTIYNNTLNAFASRQLRFVPYSELLKQYEDNGAEPTKIISDETVERIERVLKMLEENINSQNMKVDDDGTCYVKKYSSTKTGLIDEKQWFECSNEDPDKMMKITVFGGWFGLHKFMEHNILAGIGYLLTCGFFGVYYIIDVLETAFGNRSYYTVTYREDEKTLIREKKKIYYKPVKNKVLAILFSFLAVGIVVLLLNTLYKSAYVGIMNLIKGALDSYSSNQINGLYK